MPESSLPVEHLFTMTANLGGASVIQDGPQGSRVIVAVSGGSFDGPRLKGTIVPNSGCDWVTRRADGSLKLDVRITLQTEDGAAIYMAYNGIGKPQDGGNVLRTAPLFETGDERYAWLNAVQAVATGTSGGGAVTYDVYALSF
ncbi:MAG: DUF3237 domain-containing protein [Dehalococcoidia bacterium]